MSVRRPNAEKIIAPNLIPQTVPRGEAMYDNNINGRVGGRWVEVVKQ
ncbi:MAG: hypothetical protein WCX31_04120 [Salinivirgaceae bacterium]